MSDELKNPGKIKKQEVHIGGFDFRVEGGKVKLILTNIEIDIEGEIDDFPAAPTRSESEE